MSTLPTLESITSEIPSLPSTAAYLIFSDGNRTLVFEKDYRTAVSRVREDFIVATNSDRFGEDQRTIDGNAGIAAGSLGSEIEGFLAESVSRGLCVRAEWREAVIRATGVDPGDDGEHEDVGAHVQRVDVVEWLGKWPITNECTHYATVMDPKEGNIVWLKRFLEPVLEPLDTLNSGGNCRLEQGSNIDLP